MAACLFPEHVYEQGEDLLRCCFTNKRCHPESPRNANLLVPEPFYARGEGPAPVLFRGSPHFAPNAQLLLKPHFSSHQSSRTRFTVTGDATV